MAFEQNDTRRSNVERQAQQRRDQQNGREDREIQGFLGVDRNQHDEHRNGDIEGEKEIQNERPASGNTIIARIIRISTGAAICVAFKRPRIFCMPSRGACHLRSLRH
jgi:hypothetical protein